MDIVTTTEDLLGVTPTGVRVTGSSNAFFVDLDDQTVVVKFAAHGRSVLAEAWAYQMAAAQGIRVPKVLATRSDPEVVAVECLAGASLWSDERRGGDNSRAWQQVGADMRALHEINVAGFGPLKSGVGGCTGRSETWSSFVRFAREEGIRKLVDSEVLESRVGGILESRYDEAVTELHRCSDGRLLHGDMEGGHILVADGQYQGIIDFDQAQVGDPRWDLARVPLWDGDVALDAVLDGYGRDTLGPGDREVLLPLYLLAFVIHHAAQFADRGQLADARAHLAQAGYKRLL
jgi:aminoglycoside phosphotransferase